MLALHADLLDFPHAPAWGDTTDAGARFRPGHWLLIGDDGCIQAIQTEPPDAAWPREDHRGCWLLPGFIDSHVHCPQLDVLASHGTALLDWLDRYTFPAELHHADAAHSAAAAARFLDALLAHGTTAAVVFATVHAHSAAALFDGAAARGMRIVTGKVLMDRHAPPGLLDDPDPKVAERECLDLIARHHGRARNTYAVTVRFAPASTPAQLAMAGALCRADPTLVMQTHVAENTDEVRWARELFPQARSYLDIYARAGLLHPRAVLAHGIWLDAEDRALLADTGAHIAHSPGSNLFLGSGLYDWPAALAAGHATSLASDVGGGTHLCALRSAAEAYKVQALRGARLTAWTALHAATAGAADALGLGHEIGRLEPGLMADLSLWDPAATPLAAHRDEVAQRQGHGLHARVFAWMMLGDERNLAATFVAGRALYRRPVG